MNADICFTLPDTSDWTVWAAHLEYGGQAVSEFSSTMLSRQDASGDQPGQRCEQLGFYVPPDAKDDKALKMADDLLRGTIVNADFPANPKKGLPN